VGVDSIFDIWYNLKRKERRAICTKSNLHLSIT
jgi:hypothetical protein